jgi:hypothetical protein
VKVLDDLDSQIQVPVAKHKCLAFRLLLKEYFPQLIKMSLSKDEQSLATNSLPGMCEFVQNTCPCLTCCDHWFSVLTVCTANTDTDMVTYSNGHGMLESRVIPDSQSDATPIERASRQNSLRRTTPVALPYDDYSLISSPSPELLASRSSRDEPAGPANSPPKHGRYCDCPMHIFTDLLSSLSYSLNEIKDEVVRLEVAFDALSASARTYRCLDVLKGTT